MMRKQLSKSEIKDLNSQLAEYGVEFSKKDQMHVEDGVYEKDGKNVAFTVDEKVLPTLHSILAGGVMKKITVDMGAIKFIMKGADIMRPGITDVSDGIEKGDYVVVVDETHGKPLAVCEALFSGDEIRSMDSGKVLNTVHFIGDELF